MLGEFAKYAFCGLKRKRRDFERSVLKYVSIKIPALTHSGCKSRVCVNQPDRLSPAANPLLLFFCLPPCPSSEAGREVAFLKLARAKRGRWLVLNEFAKYAFCGLKRKRRDFERSVLKYVSIKSSALTHSGCKSRVCVNALDRLYPAAKLSLPFSFTSPCHRTASRQNGCNPWGNSPRNHRNWCNSPHPASCA